MTLSNVNNAASKKSGSGQTGPDRMGLFISVCGFKLTWFSIWFSVFVKNSNGFSKFLPVCSQSERQLSTSTDLAKRKCY